MNSFKNPWEITDEMLKNPWEVGGGRSVLDREEQPIPSTKIGWLDQLGGIFYDEIGNEIGRFGTCDETTKCEPKIYIITGNTLANTKKTNDVKKIDLSNTNEVFLLPPRQMCGEILGRVESLYLKENGTKLEAVDIEAGGIGFLNEKGSDIVHVVVENSSIGKNDLDMYKFLQKGIYAQRYKMLVNNTPAIELIGINNGQHINQKKRAIFVWHSHTDIKKTITNNLPSAQDIGQFSREYYAALSQIVISRKAQMIYFYTKDTPINLQTQTGASAKITFKFFKYLYSAKSGTRFTKNNKPPSQR